jgi:hypothetical protein
MGPFRENADGDPETLASQGKFPSLDEFLQLTSNFETRRAALRVYIPAPLCSSSNQRLLNPDGGVASVGLEV